MNLKLIIHTFSFSALLACCTVKEHPSQGTGMSQKELQEALIQRNRDFLEAERESIADYKADSELGFIETGSGLSYSILSRGESQEYSPKEGDMVEYAYDITTISGNKLKNSKEEGNKKFRVLKDDEIFGIHEGVQLMHLNDEFLFIIPAHLAYGLENQNTAPLNATLLYKVKIVSIN